MPISEDEYDHHGSNNSNSDGNGHHQSIGMSKAELRRSNKPIMEKRRRARINHCLNELKTLILDAMKKDPARHSKLEKADILEMTVKHLQSLQRQQMNVSVATDPTVIHKFKSGFNECAGEVSRFISNMEGVDNGVKQRLIAHLNSCVTGLQQIAPPFTFPGFSLSNTYSNTNNNITSHSNSNNNNNNNNSASNIPVVMPHVPYPLGDVNNNTGDNTISTVNSTSARIQMPGGIQLIPSRLPTGELALLVPNSSNMPFFPGFNSSIPPTILDSSSSLQAQSTVTSTNKSATPSSSTSTHFSAFTSVISNRSKSPTNLSYHRSKLRNTSPISPTSSSTSHSDDYSHIIERHIKNNRSPSPLKLNQNPLYQYQINIDKSRSSIISQQQVTSSTPTSPKTKNQELKIAYQTVPIYQPVERTRLNLHGKNDVAEPLSALSPMHHLQPGTPLSVTITTNDRTPIYRDNTPSLDVTNSLSRKRSISFKNDTHNQAADGLLVVAKTERHTPPSSPKLMRYSIGVVSSSQSTSSPELSSSINCNRSSTDSGFSSLESSSPSSLINTSGGSSTSDANSSNSEPMWRPW